MRFLNLPLIKTHGSHVRRRENVVSSCFPSSHLHDNTRLCHTTHPLPLPPRSTGTQDQAEADSSRGSVARPYHHLARQPGNRHDGPRCELLDLLVQAHACLRMSATSVLTAPHPPPFATIKHRHKTGQKRTRRRPHSSCLWRGQATVSQARCSLATSSTSQLLKRTKLPSAASHHQSTRCSSYFVYYLTTQAHKLPSAASTTRAGTHGVLGGKGRPNHP